MTAGLSPSELRQLETICLKLARQPAHTGTATEDNNEDMHP